MCKLIQAYVGACVCDCTPFRAKTVSKKMNMKKKQTKEDLVKEIVKSELKLMEVR